MFRYTFAEQTHLQLIMAETYLLNNKDARGPPYVPLFSTTKAFWAEIKESLEDGLEYGESL